MDLSLLRKNLLNIFNADKDNLPDCILKKILNNDVNSYNAYIAAVNGNLKEDYLSKIYQYDFAEREKMKQDYTPLTLASLSARLLNDNKKLSIFDQCAGTGSLSIALWNINKNIIVTAIEMDRTNIPFLLFNYVIRNITAKVINGDALDDNGEFVIYQVTSGEKYSVVKKEG